MPNNAIPVSYQVEELEQSLLLEAQELFARNGSAKVFPDNQFSDSKGKLAMAVTARHKGHLIGFNATMPVKCYDGDKDFDAIWSCDFIVDESWRAFGVGSNIKSLLKEKITCPVMSLGISAKAERVLKKSGWNIQDSVRNFTWVVRPKSIRSWLLFTINRFRSAFNKNYSTPTSPQLSITIPSQERIDYLWDKTKRFFNVSVSRNFQYLNWRYSDGYEFLSLDNINGEFSTLIIFRKVNHQSLKIVDILQDPDHIDTLNTALQYLVNIPDIASVSFPVCNRKIEKYLERFGFVAGRHASKFAYRANHNSSEALPWSLTAGDSDGEYIAKVQHDSLRSNINRLNEQSTHLEKIDCTSILVLKNEWSELLTQSNCNKLFMNIHWIDCWWSTWKTELSEKFESELFLHRVRSNNETIAILPLYKIRKKRFGIYFNELHFLGNATRLMPTVRSEYIQPIIKKGYEDIVLNEFALWLQTQELSTVIVWPDCAITSLSNGFKSIEIKKDVGIIIDTKFQSFDWYVKKLGKTTRTKGVNRLERLEREFSSVEWSNLQPTSENLKYFFSQLNLLHSNRWGKACFDDLAVDFHTRVIENTDNFSAQLSLLKVNGKLVSALYNLSTDGITYNLQSGFSLLFDKSYSLGTMHLMHSIKYAFEDTNTRAFDMLAGEGMNEHYKAHYKGKPIEFTTRLMFSSRYYYWLFRLRKYLKAGVMSTYKRIFHKRK